MFIDRLPFVDCDSQTLVVDKLTNEWICKSDTYLINYLYYSNYVLLFKDDAFRDSILLSDRLLIDGIGMQLYLQMVKGIWPNNLNGTDLNPTFIKTLSDKNIPIALYGTDQKNIEQCRKNLEAKQVKTIYYIQDGFSPLEWSNIKENSALFVGMGSPRQELWVKENLDKIKELRLFIVTVGGYFDFESGFYVRAPLLIRKLKLEWLWRTMLHPKRHYKKRIRDLSIIFKPIVDRLKGYGRLIHLNKIE